MIWVDIVLAVAVLGFIGAGVKDGFVHTLGRLVGAIVGFVAARAWSLKIAPALAIFLPAGWARLISFIVIFLLITRLVGFAFKIVEGAFRILVLLPFLRSINSLLGGLLGLAEGIIMLGGAIYLVLTYSLEPTLVQWLKASSLSSYILMIFQALLGLLL